MNPAKPSVIYALQYIEKKKSDIANMIHLFTNRQIKGWLKVLIILRTRAVHAELQHMPEEEA